MEPKRWGLENCMMLQDDCGQFIDIEDYERMESDLRRQLAEVTAERELFCKQTAVLWKAVRAMQDLIDQSQGVYGLHLNGDGAPWATLRKGGQFEEWLLDFDDALESADDEAQAALRREK